MRRILFATAQEDFSFPLAEAARKQVLAEAQACRREGLEAVILVVTPASRAKCDYDGLPIHIVPRRHLWRYVAFCSRFDELRYFGTTGVIAIALSWMMPFRDRTLVLTDGGLFSVGRHASRRQRLAPLAISGYHRVAVYTDYQAKLLTQRIPGVIGKLVRTSPVLDVTPSAVEGDRTQYPSLLYLGHPSLFKGFDLVLDCFEILAREDDSLCLTIASNGLDYGDSCLARLRALQTSFPSRVALKGKVDPLREIRRCHLLLYPLRQHCGTFAFPLSLYECLRCGTPFLAGKLEALEEFFDPTFLCDQLEPDRFAQRVRSMLSQRFGFEQRLLVNLETLHQKFFADEYAHRHNLNR